MDMSHAPNALFLPSFELARNMQTLFKKKMFFLWAGFKSFLASRWPKLASLVTLQILKWI